MRALYVWVDRHWLGLTLLLLLLIVLLSLWPAQQLPAVPGSDKTHHFIAYTVLMLPAALHRSAHLWRYAGMFLLLSIAIELIQPTVNRYGEWQDVLANGVGLLLGWLLGRLARWRWGSGQGQE